MSGVLLGTEKNTGKSIYISPEARRLGTYVVGAQGMGKTNLLQQIVISDIRNGDGVCVLSPHSDLIEGILQRIPKERANDVIVFDPSDDAPIGLNVFAWNDKNSLLDTFDRVADEVIVGIFKQLWHDSWGPRMEEVMYMTACTIYLSQCLPPEKRPTLREFVDVIAYEGNTRYRDYLISNLRDLYNDLTVENIINFWSTLELEDDRLKKEQTRSTMNKARRFQTNRYLAHVFGQSQSSLDLQSVMEQGKILLCDLSVDKVGEGNTGLLGSLLVARLYLAAISRDIVAVQAPTKPFHIIADEFSFFASSAFGKLQDQTRKFNVDVLLAHQRRGQLTDDMKDATITSQNWVVLNVNPEDARELSAGFDSTPPPSYGRRKQQDFVLAPKPWDELQRQSHSNPAVVDTVSYLMGLAFQGSSWLASEDQIDTFFFYAPEKVTRSKFEKYFDGFQRDNYDKFQVRATSVSPRAGIPYDNVISSLNEYLYWRMAQRNTDEATSNVEWLTNCHAVAPSVDLGFRPTDRYIETIDSLPFIRIDSTQEEILSTVATIVGNYISSGKFHYRERETAIMLSHYLAFQIRFYLRDNLVHLGNLLAKEPVYVRGGQPIEEENPRSFSDVTEEWRNRFAHLPQFEAWVKTKADGRVVEHHIQTKEVKQTNKNGPKVAELLRKISKQRYGIGRSKIETRIRKRLEVPDGNQRIGLSEIIPED